MGENGERTPLGELVHKLAAEIDQAKDDYVLLEDVAWPVEVRGVNVWVAPALLRVATCGDLVRVRLAGEQATHVGIYLGDLLVPSFLVAYRKSTQEFQVPVRTNPAIFVPALRRVVWGQESWWGPVKDAADLERAITAADIDGQPYVQMLRALAEKEAG
jgi:cell wall-associated NlpC family hydrolase